MVDIPVDVMTLREGHLAPIGRKPPAEAGSCAQLSAEG
jgi:hypothetical protein